MFTQRRSGATNVLLKISRCATAPLRDLFDF